jgi:HSP20 family molecular chaperone IbpA
MFYTINDRMVNDFFNDLDSIFDDSESLRRTNRNKSNHKIESDDNGVTLTMNVPGYNKKLIDISIEGETLIIEGKSNSGNPNGFTERFTMCDKHDSENIDASVIDGILTLSVPYQPESIPRKIEVKVK